VPTLAGLTPLLLEKSPQAQLLIPLATCLAFGLAAATVIAMFLVPALYCVLQDLGWVNDAPGQGSVPTSPGQPGSAATIQPL